MWRCEAPAAKFHPCTFACEHYCFVYCSRN